jgi:hypothetical protein
MNSFAKAWLEAAADLKIRVIHPFSFASKDGLLKTSVGVYLPDFGSRKGTLLTCRFDPYALCDIADSTDFYSSGLNPSYYEPYGREIYVETLNDWGWFSATEPPNWYTGKSWT